MRAALLALAATLGCAGDVTGGDHPDRPADASTGPADDPGGAPSPDAGPDWVAEPLMIGIASGHPTFMDHADIEAFFQSSRNERHFRMGHMYVPWNVALEDSDRRASLEQWLARAAELDLEPLIVFEPERGSDGAFSTDRPTVAELAAAFDEFRATWPGVHRFIAWNEPNAPVTEVTPTLAADYYLMVNERCGDACTVAAGNFRAMTANDDEDLRMTGASADAPDCGADASYLDRYKCRLGAHRPRIWAFHPYLDGDRYRRAASHCGDPDICQTRMFMAQLAGSWSDSEVWMTEAGALYAAPNLAASAFEQACAGAFYQRLFRLPEWGGRVTRFYYFNWYGYGNDMGLVDKAKPYEPRPIFDVLRDRETNFDPTCP